MIRARINQRKKKYVQMTTNLIADVMKKYNVKNVNPKVAAFALLGMLNWTYQWYKPSGSSSAATRSSAVFSKHFSEEFSASETVSQ